MLRTIVRLLFLRFLPRRLLPLFTAWQVLQIIRNRRNRSAKPPGATPELAAGRTSSR